MGLIRVIRLCVIVLGFSLQVQSLGAVTELKYALFTSGPLGGFDSSGAVPAIELAEEILNQNNSVLSGYRLTHTEVEDTVCERGRSLDLFFDKILFTDQAVLGLLGCGCSVASTPVAEIIHHLSISQIAYGSSSVEINDRKRFPNFFRTYPSDADFTPTVISVVRYYGWKRIAFITQEEGIFTGAFERLTEPLGDLGVEVRNKMFPSGEIPINGIMDKETNFFFEDDDYRVFFVNTYSNFARHIICEVYKRGYTYPRYVWLLYAWYADRWWTEEINPQTAWNCTDNQLAGLLERGIAMQIYPIAYDENAMTDTGLTPNQFYNLYQRKFDLNETNYTSSYLATVAYDALWSLAFALDRTNKMITEDSRNEILVRTRCLGSNSKTGIPFDLVPLENFTHSNELMGCIVRWSLERTEFMGLSGPVQFNDAGSRVQSQSQILQYRIADGDTTNESIHRVMIAFTKFINVTTTVFMYRENESNNTVYPEVKGGIPPDGTPFIEINTYHLALVVTYYIFAVAGLVFSTVCLVFNVTMRNKKIVRLTSPNLNFVIITGTYIMYISIFFRILPSTNYTINFIRCELDALMYNIGYCLAFGAVLAKMGRIYYIFHNPTSNKTAMKDWHLILIALAITSIGALLSVLQVTVPQLRPQPQLHPDHEYGVGMDESGVKINYMVYQCSTSTGSTWIIIRFVYLALLQLIGIILAIQTRKVKIKVLNDSKFIAALIYISSIVLLLIAIVQFISGNVININELIFSGGIIVITTAFLGLVFIPKMLSLYRDPRGEKIFDKAAHGTSSQAIEASLSGRKTSTLSNSYEPQQTKELEARIAELESQLRQRKREQTPEESVKSNSRRISQQPLLKVCFDESETSIDNNNMPKNIALCTISENRFSDDADNHLDHAENGYQDTENGYQHRENQHQDTCTEM